MGDFFTKDQKNSWNEYVNEDVDVIEEPIVECPSGFQKNSEGECVEIVKIDDIESEQYACRHRKNKKASFRV